MGGWGRRGKDDKNKMHWPRLVQSFVLQRALIFCSATSRPINMGDETFHFNFRFRKLYKFSKESLTVKFKYLIKRTYVRRKTCCGGFSLRQNIYFLVPTLKNVICIIDIQFFLYSPGSVDFIKNFWGD